MLAHDGCVGGGSPRLRGRVVLGATHAKGAKLGDSFVFPQIKGQLRL